MKSQIWRMLSAFQILVHCLQAEQPPTVTLSSGVFQGLSTTIPNTKTTVNKYLSVPFAAPPLGSLRFAPPQPAPNSTEVRKADKQPPACIQNGGNSALSENEDCLYLNVFMPSANSNDGGRAVMIWLFGGGLQSGSAGVPLYDGSNLAGNQDVVVVVPNYRTNVKYSPFSPHFFQAETKYFLGIRVSWYTPLSPIQRS
jgi:acetyl esterase/lipase